MPTGVCTARIQIQDSTFPGCFAVLRECSKELILGLDFLREYGAVIDLRDLLVTFSNPLPADDERDLYRPALRICDEIVTLPPRSSMFVTVECEQSPVSSGIAEQNISLLLDRQVCAARGLVDISNRRTEILLTNFSPEHQHLSHGTAVAYLDAVSDEERSIVLGVFATQKESEKVAKIDVNPDLPVSQQQQLRDLLDSFGDCFAVTSKVRQTTIAKHRIITDEDERPIRQHPYRVS